MTGTGANPMAAAPEAASGSATSSGSSSATISANDFLTLLVTEMQNQDPTAQTDPDEYINQLVQVNSLEQLIDINQNLTTALGDPSTTATGNSTTQAAGAHATSAQTMASGASLSGAGAAGKAAQTTVAAHKATPATTAAHKTATLPASVSPGSNTAAAISQFAKSAGAKHAPGNLSVPPAHAAAHKVAHALNGQSHLPKTPGKPAGAQ